MARLESDIRELVLRETHREAAIEWLLAHDSELEQEMDDARSRIRDLEAEIAAMHRSVLWRTARLLRRSVSVIRQPRRLADVARGRLAGRDAEPSTAAAVTVVTPPGVAEDDASAIDVRGLRFEPPAEPRVSIVIPVHGLAGVTVRCLQALAAATPPDAYEVIIADDASPAGTLEVLSRIEGLRIVSSPVNRGFLENANMGAAAARGDCVLFLNNDTEPCAGWLEPLLDAIDSAPDVAAVGSKLVYADGRLQEAGGLVWSDGSAWNLGHGGDPQAPRYNVRREVDYCSAAALVVRRSVWESVGGFDPRYGRGYYEDTDLCMSLRAAGYRVLYEPASQVIHHRGLSFGDEDRDPDAAVAKVAAMQANRVIFSAKWSEALTSHWPAGTAAGLLGGRIDRRVRVLVCDHRLPTYDRDSGGLRMWWIIRLLNDLGCAVSVYPDDRQRTEPYTRELQRAGVEVVYDTDFEDFTSERAGLYDVILISRARIMKAHLDAARRTHPNAVIVYDTVDLHHVREERRRALVGANGAPDDPELTDIRDLEAALMRRADIVAAVSEEEADIISRMNPGGRVVVLPNVHAIDDNPRPALGDRDGILFIGGFEHPPNVDAILWFTEEVLPRIRRRMPVTFYCLGSLPPAEIRALQSPDIVVTGQIADGEPYFDRARVFVAPLRYGAGVKGKVGHAMASRLPVVTTTIGAEGLGIADGVHALVRDDPAAFADAVVRLAHDADLWSSMADAAHTLIAGTMSPDLMRARLDTLVGAVRTQLGRA